MNQTDTPTKVPLDGAVRPLYYVHEGPNGDTFTVTPEEYKEVCEHCRPMYGQAELDATVAAERERCARLCEDYFDKDMAAVIRRGY